MPQPPQAGEQEGYRRVVLIAVDGAAEARQHPSAIAACCGATWAYFVRAWWG